MADFNLTEVRYVLGPDNVVPDFLSRLSADEQGQDRAAIRPLHLLSTAPPVRHTSLHSLRQDPCSSVVVLPTWKGSVAVQRRGGACGLWAAACQKGDTPLQTVKHLQSALTRDPTAKPIVTHVAQLGAVALWQMDFLEAAIQWKTQASAELQWMLPLTLPERSLWHRAHFKMLSDFGV